MTDSATALRVFPDDLHNRALVSHVHPLDWVNPAPEGVYAMVVIGAGTAGLVTAVGAAGLGKRVALIERHLMGGDCLNVGCVPSKALIRAGRVAADVRRAGEYGIHVPDGVEVDFAAVMDRMRRLRAYIAPHDGAKRFADLGVDVYLGKGTFTGRDRLEVDGRTLRFKKACIATGARASVPPIPGLDQVGYLTNETIFSLTELPRRLAVIGAGPIGCELAQAFARFGSQVYLIEAAHGILTREDPAASHIVEESLQRDGVTLLCCGKKTTVRAEGDAKRINLSSHDEQYDLEVDEILVAAGRTPNTDGLGLDVAGVEHAARGVRVNDKLRTTNPRIYAAGDVCSAYKLTHAADANARIVVQNALLPWLPMRARASKLVIPWCTYTDPEIAHVGEYPRELDAAGVTYRTVTIPLSANDRAILEGHTDGFLEVHVKPSGRILGATLVARHAGDMISELTTAIVHRIKLQQMARVIHPYPTEAEVIKRVGDQYFKTWLLGLKQKLIGGSNGA